MTPEDITVGVATCGRPRALARCLEGLAGGTGRPGEVLVVDQEPSAEARIVVARCGLGGARYLTQERLGLSASRNLALVNATRSVLAVTDDDCAPDPGWLDAMAGALDREPRPDAVTGAILPLGDPTPGTFAISLRDSATAVDYRGQMLPWDVGSGANFAASCRLLRALEGWDERLGAGSPGKAGEDSELLYRMLSAGLVIRYDPTAVVRHEWQTRARRLATRWSYGFGIGVLCGLRMRRADPFAWRMLAGYARLHVRPLLRAATAADSLAAAQHGRALASLPAGLLHGLRAPQRPPVQGVGTGIG